MLFQILSRVRFVKYLFHSSEILLIYLNNLCNFHVLCYVLVLQCGNSPEDCCVFFQGVTTTACDRVRLVYLEELGEAWKLKMEENLLALSKGCITL